MKTFSTSIEVDHVDDDDVDDIDLDSIVAKQMAKKKGAKGGAGPNPNHNAFLVGLKGI